MLTGKFWCIQANLGDYIAAENIESPGMSVTRHALFPHRFGRPIFNCNKPTLQDPLFSINSYVTARVHGINV
jgi:hypothetical protein